MLRIEIYQRATRFISPSERFCIQMNYPHVLRDTRDEATERELQLRLADMPMRTNIFIGEEHIGSLKDLMNLESFVVQQKIGG